MSIILTFKREIVSEKGPCSFYDDIVDVSPLIIEYMKQKVKLPEEKKGGFYSLKKGNNIILEYLSCDGRYSFGSSCYNARSLHAEKLTMEDIRNIISDKFIVVSKYHNGIVSLRKLRVSDFSEVDIVTISNVDGFEYFREGKRISLKDVQEFLGAGAVSSNFKTDLCALIYDKHVQDIAAKDISTQLYNFLEEQYFLHENAAQYLEAYSYFANRKALLYLEYVVKNNMEISTVVRDNPYYTDEPYRDVSEIHKLSPLGMELVKKLDNRWDNNDVSLIIEKLEKHPKIGVNGLKYVSEIIGYIHNIRLSGVYWLFSARELDIYRHLLVVLDNYDITLKTLMERAVKAMFLDGVSLGNYLIMTIDYKHMRETLGLKVERKLPKNLIELHNILTERLAEIREEKNREDFEIKARENSEIAERFLGNDSDANFTIVCPKTCADLVAEGQNMHHCVGSYVERVINGYSKIFFIREKNNIDNCFVTLELDAKNNFVQARAQFNTEPSKAAYDYICKFVKEIGGNI